MNFTLLKSIRLVMFVLISYIYYFNLGSHTTIQFIFVMVASIGFCINHIMLITSFGKNYFPILIVMDSILTIGFVFLFPGSTLYLILFGVNAVTIFLFSESQKVITRFSVGFFLVWGGCIYYTYYATGVIDVMSNIVNFTFILFSAVVGRLIHKLELAQVENEKQYEELQKTHDALKDAHQQLHLFSQQVEELTLIRERNRISGEIHDTVGHKMTALLVQLQVAKELLDIQPEKSKQTVLLCEELARNALQEIRLSVRTLKDTDKPQSFITVTRKILEDFQKMTGLKSSFQLHGDASRIPISMQLDITRVIQESITNAVRHGQATECQIKIEVTDMAVEAMINDNGKGSSEISPGFGLKHMRERVIEHGGRIVFEGMPDTGFIVKASFPLKEIRWQIGGGQ
ncbi:sensor histidine kinase [Metabacillus niabensis]|uniref:sensor histidine kinase n=1 Tax=Metabacillus niabensis TaxID=324854 RepID=UPI00399F3E1D